MKILLILGAALLVSASIPSMANAQTTACATEASTARGSNWYYRIIDGRKCWYQGKAMMPKENFHWPKSTTVQADTTTEKPRATTSQPPAAVQPETDGRSVASPSPVAAEPAAAWPTPAVNNDISFESRWLGLQSGK